MLQFFFPHGLNFPVNVLAYNRIAVSVARLGAGARVCAGCGATVQPTIRTRALAPAAVDARAVSTAVFALAVERALLAALRILSQKVQVHGPSGVTVTCPGRCALPVVIARLVCLAKPAFAGARVVVPPFVCLAVAIAGFAAVNDVKRIALVAHSPHPFVFANGLGALALAAIFRNSALAAVSRRVVVFINVNAAALH